MSEREEAWELYKHPVFQMSRVGDQRDDNTEKDKKRALFHLQSIFILFSEREQVWWSSSRWNHLLQGPAEVGAPAYKGPTAGPSQRGDPSPWD